MKAIVINEYGGTEQLVLKNLAMPEPSSGEVLIRVKAFGINRAEVYMRLGLWGEVARVSGIECVGEVVSDQTGELVQGQKVVAIMGGMGRSRNGSYAEFTCVPAANVLPVETSMDWTDLAAIPESYVTAWSCLHDNMQLKSGQTVVVRGATSALGQAAVNIAANIDDVRIIATTRNFKNVELLQNLGAAETLIDDGGLSQQLRKKYPEGVDSVLDIVGNSCLLDSLQMVKKDGFVCQAGFLGGTESLQFNPLTDMPAGVNLNFFASFMYGTPAFPLSEIPLQDIVTMAEKGCYKSKPVEVFAFEDIALAHELMESDMAGGKIVVRI
ncbi:MAG: zinc-binding dehydrogenase [Arenicella sp.]